MHIILSVGNGVRYYIQTQLEGLMDAFTGIIDNKTSVLYLFWDCLHHGKWIELHLKGFILHSAYLIPPPLSPASGQGWTVLN